MLDLYWLFNCPRDLNDMSDYKQRVTFRPTTKTICFWELNISIGYKL